MCSRGFGVNLIQNKFNKKEKKKQQIQMKNLNRNTIYTIHLHIDTIHKYAHTFNK